MFSNLNTIFNNSKIDKRNYKAKKMQTYRDSLQKTYRKQQQQLEKINKIPEEIVKKVDLDDSIFIEEKMKNLEAFQTTADQIVLPLNMNINANKLNDFFNDLDGYNESNITVNEYLLLDDENNISTKTNKMGLMGLFITEIDQAMNLEKIPFNNLHLLQGGIQQTFSNKLHNNNNNNNDNTNVNNAINNNSTTKTIDFSILNKINTIHFVYKQSYKNKFVTGFGDFLRGCYFILEFCQKFKLTPNIIILHPINAFLKNKSNSNAFQNNIYDTIEFFEYINYSNNVNCTYNTDTTNLYNEMFAYLNRQPIYNNQLFLYTICYPTTAITQPNKKIIQKIIEPTDEIHYLINNILKNLQLVKKQFIIIHIRSGDQFLNKTDKKMTHDYKNKIINSINQFIDKNENYLLIADNILVKSILARNFPFIKTYFKNITHLGENANLDYENMKNTMIDFFIISYAKQIYSISSYDHGSGFSRWSAFTHDVPYQCVQIIV
jgi:hypothetical protein